MKSLLKSIAYRSPIPLRRYIYASYCNLFALYAWWRAGRPTPYSPPQGVSQKVIRVAFYHISGLHFAGTEKFIQILAKHLHHDQFEVYFIYSAKSRTSDSRPADSRKDYLANTHVHLVPFDYESLEQIYPFFVHDAKPTLNQILKDIRPHVLVTTGAGYPEYPFNIETKVPIISINNFGAPNLQRNVKMNICVSEAVANMACRVTPKEKTAVMYIPMEKPRDLTQQATLLRTRLGLKVTDTVFGRIGRADNEIFDPIGIKAFAQLVGERNDVHYLIMSPPPILEEIVCQEKIQNVHFLPPSGQEEDVWTFHHAIDVLAHFRYDGESFGLNIAESMMAGNPIITHRSRIWNAHLEYLDDSFARIANTDDVESYASFMHEFAELNRKNQLGSFRTAAKAKAEKLFLIDNTINDFEHILKRAVT